MTEQDLHQEHLAEDAPDPEAVADETDELAPLAEDDDELEATEADLLAQRAEAHPGATAEDDYRPH